GGGVERFVNGLSRYLILNGNDVHIMISGAENKIYIKNNIKFIQIKVKFPYFKKLIYNIKLYFYVKKNRNKYDIAHINGDNGCFASRIGGLNKIMTLHGTSLFSAGVKQNFTKVSIIRWGLMHPNLFFSYLMERYSVRHCSTIITVSAGLLDTLKKIYSKNDISVINIGINTAYFRPGDRDEIRKELNMDDKLIYALWVGMYPERKRLNFAMELIKNSKNMHLICIGNTEKYSGNDRIHLLGHVPDDTLLKYYQACDLLLLPSVSEAFSLTIVEGMACGLVPVTGKNVYMPGLKNNINSFIAGTDDDYKDIITKIEDKPDILIKMSENAIKTAYEYSDEKTYSRYLDVMQKIVYKK
ncbi:glycosyltransferase family 4 protein, partial [Acidiplasma aeolicum]|uniref:glycosyltransferase family 4 protein n=1 Tax=Acidiplasma aeolicum TaxID=507754 RepID=UPI00371D6B39